jgi:hypothetical protein
MPRGLGGPGHKVWVLPRVWKDMGHTVWVLPRGLGGLVIWKSKGPRGLKGFDKAFWVLGGRGVT